VRPRLALAAVCAVLFLTFLDTTIVAVALADIQSDLHAGVSQLQWVVSAYALPFASLMLLAGALGDRFGRKRVMVVGIVIFLCGSIIGALADSSNALVVGRAVMGVGAAASEPATLSVIRQVFTEQRARARAIGVWSGVAALALAAGPVFGGVLVGVGGWQAVFWFNVGAAVVVLALAAFWVPESSDPLPGRLDFPGFILGTLSLAALVFAILQGESLGYANGVPIALFVVAILAGIAFVFVERRTEAPMLDVRYFRLPAFSGALFEAFALYFGVFSIFFFSALYIQVVVGYSGYRTAGLFLPMTLAMIVGALVSGRWVGARGARVPMTVGAFVAGAGLVLTEIALRGLEPPFLPLTVALALAGLGFGFAVVPVTSVALSAIPAARSGMAASAANTSRELGALVGVAVLGSMVNGELTNNLAQRLNDLGVPASFQGLVVNAVETGQVPGGGTATIRDAETSFGPLVAKVVTAAFDAFHSGLDIALTVSAVVIVLSGILAWFTLRRPHTLMP
jgi:EmrB/QacA subfamily drug resistance transporter